MATGRPSPSRPTHGLKLVVKMLLLNGFCYNHLVAPLQLNMSIIYLCSTHKYKYSYFKVKICVKLCSFRLAANFHEELLTQTNFREDTTQKICLYIDVRRPSSMDRGYIFSWIGALTFVKVNSHYICLPSFI